MGSAARSWRLVAAGFAAVLVSGAGCSDSEGSSESAFCQKAKHWIASFSEDMTIGERAGWLASASDLTDAAPEGIRDDLGLLAAAGEYLQEPAISEGGLIDAPDFTPSQITRAQDEIATQVAEACAN